MQFTREIRHLLIAMLGAFGVVALAAVYWAVVGADTILLRPDNPRLVEAESRLIRGDITDRNGTPLVTSIVNENGSVTRRYLYPETHGALGYASLRYGVSGAEEAYNRLLRGDDLPQNLLTYFENGILHRPRRGSDVRLTLDLPVQQEAARAMEGQTGALIALALPEGEVLALVSRPTYDPNTLDMDWETLVQSPGNPFFNRALQGSYQPGGALETPLIAAGLLTGYALDTPVENATRPVQVGDVTLNCAALLPSRPLTLREAYAFACPAPFAELVGSLGFSAVRAALETFRLDQPVNLTGFAPDTPPSAALRPDSIRAAALGQGELTVTPLQMAVLTAAIINDGNAPQPYTLLAVHPPEADDWTTVPAALTIQPMTTANTARQLQDMMRLAVAQGAAQNAARPNQDIGGHASIAYSGDESLAWFIGFTTLGGRRGVAIAVVLEKSSDPGLAADIGGRVLAAAHARMQSN
jgi:peptidoglycan glycosyltransferase